MEKNLFNNTPKHKSLGNFKKEISLFQKICLAKDITVKDISNRLREDIFNNKKIYWMFNTNQQQKTWVPNGIMRKYTNKQSAKGGNPNGQVYEEMLCLSNSGCTSSSSSSSK